jgi:hypothetical protein
LPPRAPKIGSAGTSRLGRATGDATQVHQAQTARPPRAGEEGILPPRPAGRSGDVEPLPHVAGPEAGAVGDHGQRRLTGPDRHRAVRPGQGRRGKAPSRADDGVGAAGQAVGHRRRGGAAGADDARSVTGQYLPANGLIGWPDRCRRPRSSGLHGDPGQSAAVSPSHAWQMTKEHRRHRSTDRRGTVGPPQTGHAGGPHGSSGSVIKQAGGTVSGWWLFISGVPAAVGAGTGRPPEEG